MHKVALNMIFNPLMKVYDEMIGFLPFQALLANANETLQNCMKQAFGCCPLILPGAQKSRSDSQFKFLQFKLIK